MSSIRHRALDAAVTLVGTEGVRALTHGRVDAAASLPPGSTSNHFRTRAALVAGVIEWIAAAERRDAGTQEFHTWVELVGGLCRVLESPAGPLGARPRARLALFPAAAAAPARPLREQRGRFEGWVRGILLDLGEADAAQHTPFLMAAAEGLLLHRLTVDPQAPIEPVIARAVDAALRD